MGILNNNKEFFDGLAALREELQLDLDHILANTPTRGVPPNILDAVELDVGFFANVRAGEAATVEDGGARLCKGVTLVIRFAPNLICVLATKGNRGAFDVPCPECFDRRSLAQQTEDEQWAWQIGNCASHSVPPYVNQVVMEQIALLASAALDQIAVKPVSLVYAYNPLTQQISVQELLPDTFCSCQPILDRSAVDPRDLELRDTLKAKHGKCRMYALSDYTLPERALLNPICGALGNRATRGYQETVTAPIFGRYMQRYAGAKPRIVTWSGLTLRLRDSRIAGIMEAIERQAGQQPAHSVAVKASYQAVSEQAINPALCCAYNAEAYSRGFGLVPFDEEVPLEWVWGYSLVSRRPVLVPRQLAYYAPHVAGNEPRLLDNNSNGCATGSCYEEAILKGLLELVERDAFMITWYRKISLPKLDFSGFPDRNVTHVLNRLDYLGFDICLLDARLDIECPAVISVARRRDDQIGAVAVGAAANPDPIEAIHGALYEAATAIVELPRLILEQVEHLRQLQANYSRIRTVSDHQYLYGFPEMAETTRWLDASETVLSWRDAYTPERDRFVDGDIGANLQILVQKLCASGLQEVAVVDQTTREERQLGLKTVIVIAPGLAPLEFGHPRNRVEHLPRLYSAPKKAGFFWDDKRPLNDMPHPFP